MTSLGDASSPLATTHNVDVAAALYQQSPGSPGSNTLGSGRSHQNGRSSTPNGLGSGRSTGGASIASGGTIGSNGNGNGRVASPSPQPRATNGVGSKKGTMNGRSNTNKGGGTNQKRGRARQLVAGSNKGRRAASHGPNGNGAVDVSPARVAEVAKKKKQDEASRREELLLAERQMAAMKKAELEAAVEFRQAKQQKRSSNRDSSPTRVTANGHAHTNGVVGKSSTQTLSPSSASSHHSNLSVSSSPPVLNQHTRHSPGGQQSTTSSKGSPYGAHHGVSPYAWPSSPQTLLERQAKQEEERHQARVYAYKQRIIQLQTGWSCVCLCLFVVCLCGVCMLVVALGVMII
jgi:hypothetical protein